MVRRKLQRRCLKMPHPILALSMIGILGLLAQMLSLALRNVPTRRISIWDSDGQIQSYLLPTDELNSSEIEYLSYRTSYSYPPEDANFPILVQTSVLRDKHIPLKVLNDHPFTYSHLPLPCSFHSNDDINIVVLIKSYVLHFGFRNALRTLWENVNDTSMYHVFMLGYSDNDGVQGRIDQEAFVYNDIIQEDFTDAYLNNTYKTIMAYNWAVRYCHKAKLLLFQDDDYHIKWTELAVYLRTQFSANLKDIYCGSLAIDAPPYRKEDTKWFLSFQDYPFDMFPPYIGGGAYVVSFDVAERLQRAFPHVRYLGIDDVYLGIVAHKLSIPAQNESILDTINYDALAKECSHIAANIVNEKCDLADKKREIYQLGFQTTTIPPVPTGNRVYFVNGQLEVDDTVYLSYDDEFSYPLKVRLDVAVKRAVLYNNKVSYMPINVHSFDKIHQPKPCTIPSLPSDNTNILIMVKSSSNNSQVREEIRTMWRALKTDPVNLVFLLGRASSKNQARINKEYEQHKDMLQEKFTETHMHSTRKIVMGFNWVEVKCSKVKLILVMDDSYFVNCSNMINYLRRIPKDKDIFTGKLWKDARPHREKGNKWKVSYEQYPFDKFPPYLSGGAYVISYSILRQFSIAFPYVKYFSIDDVFLGIIATKLRISVNHDSYFEPLSTIALVKRCPRVLYKVVNGRCLERKTPPSLGIRLMCNSLLCVYTCMCLICIAKLLC